MRTISIYVVPKINIEHDGKIFAHEIYGCEVGSPFYIFDGARYELTNEERHALKKVLGKEMRHVLKKVPGKGDTAWRRSD